MMILLTGPDTFRSRQRLQVLREAFCAKFDPSGMNVVRLDGETLTADRFNEKFSQQGFLSAKRFLAVENLLTHGAADVQEAVRDILASHADSPDTILVFWEEGSDTASKRKKTQGARKGKTAKKRTMSASLASYLASKAKVEEFPLLTLPQVRAWVEREAQRRGGTIEAKAVEAFTERVGSDLWRANAELEKILHYAGDRPVTLSDVEELVRPTIDENVFLLTDAIGQQQAGTALRVLEEQFDLGTEPLALLRMLAWHLRNLVRVRSLFDEGTTNSRSVAIALGLHPFVVQKTLLQARRFSLADLGNAYRMLRDMDATFKTRSTGHRALLTEFVLEMTRPGGASIPARR